MIVKNDPKGSTFPYKTDELTEPVDINDAPTDRQTSSGGLPGDLEREDLYPADTVTESSECQSPSLISTTRGSSGLSDTNTISAEMAETALSTDSSNTTDEGSTSASLSERYCNGVMGVPITFLDKYNPEQFEIVGSSNSDGNPYLIEKNYTELGYLFVKPTGGISGSGALRDKRTPKIKASGKKEYSVPPIGDRLEATYNRIFIQKK